MNSEDTIFLLSMVLVAIVYALIIFRPTPSKIKEWWSDRRILREYKRERRELEKDLDKLKKECYDEEKNERDR